MLIGDNVGPSPHMNTETAHARRRQMLEQRRRKEAYAAMNAQKSVQAAKQSRAAEQAHAMHQKQIDAAMQRCEKGGGMWVKGPGRFPGACQYTPRPMSGLGAEDSTTGVVVGALLGALAGYALTRKGSGAFVGAMLAPPVMYAVPMRPMYSFWF